MSLTMVVMLAAAIGAEPSRSEVPGVEHFLHAGEFARGEHVLTAALRTAPDNDQVRFELGVLQFVRGVERLGQTLYEHGCRSEHANAPFVRLPVPENPDPTPISYGALCRMLREFSTDLATAEATLAGITDHRVALKLRLAEVKFDFIGDGRSPVRFSEVLTKLMGRRPPVLDGNPEFQVRFDRGDVAWLRAYCHLLMAMIDLQLAFDFEQQFELSAESQFAKPKVKFVGTAEERAQRIHTDWQRVTVQDPVRLDGFRRHMLQVCRLNHETWTHIRAEQDNDFEWLPNSRQTGVIGLPVTEEMITGWLRMVDEMEALLDGRKKIPAWVIGFVSPQTKRGVNLKLVFQDPPPIFDWNLVQRESIRDKYLDNQLPDMDVQAFFRVGSLFQNSLGVAYGAWFN